MWMYNFEKTNYKISYVILFGYYVKNKMTHDDWISWLITLIGKLKANFSTW